MSEPSAALSVEVPGAAPVEPLVNVKEEIEDGAAAEATLQIRATSPVVRTSLSLTLKASRMAVSRVATRPTNRRAENLRETRIGLPSARVQSTVPNTRLFRTLSAVGIVPVPRTA